VEKLVFVLMGRSGSRPSGVAETLRSETAPALRRLGARRIQINVAEPGLGPPFGVDPDPDIDGLEAAVFLWVDTAEGSRVASALPDPGGSLRWHGYLVTEAEPLRNTSVPAGPDGRVPGFAQVVTLIRPEGLSWGEWRRLWQGAHTPVAIGTQSTFRYVQNVVFRALTAGAPPYAAIGEECFPAGAATDLHVFFDAVGDEARLARHMAAMSESCDRFMDGAAPVAWTTEYLIDDPA
jgi:hypothetical protein